MESIKYTPGKTMNDVLTEFNAKAMIDFLNNNFADKNETTAVLAMGTELSDSLNADGYACSAETKFEMPYFVEKQLADMSDYFDPDDEDVQKIVEDVYTSLLKIEKEINKPDFFFEREKFLREIKSLKEKLLKIDFNGGIYGF